MDILGIAILISVGYMTFTFIKMLHDIEQVRKDLDKIQEDKK